MTHKIVVAWVHPLGMGGKAELASIITYIAKITGRLTMESAIICWLCAYQKFLIKEKNPRLLEIVFPDSTGEPYTLTPPQKKLLLRGHDPPA